MAENLASEGTSGSTTISWIQASVGAFVLLLGTLVYVLDRPADSVPFLTTLSLVHLTSGFFGQVSDSLPTFSHVFAFSLLTVAWLGGRRQTGLLACLAWFSVDTAFELGQHPQIAEHLVQRIPSWFEGVPILELADSYFLSGTFDPWDLVSIAVGAAAAYVLIRCMAPKEGRYG